MRACVCRVSSVNLELSQGRSRFFPDAKRRHRIFQLALPILGGMLSQNVMNLVDTGMVGALGNEALAAVGLGSFASFMAFAFLMGMGTGVQAIAARRLGAGRRAETALPLNGGLLLVLGVGLPGSVLLIWLVPQLYPTLNSDPEVVAMGVPYLQVRLVAMAGVGMNFAFRGYWNGVNLSRLYMRTLVSMHACNIFLNWVLIFGHLGSPALGVTGAGIATAVATYLGTLHYFVLALRHARGNGFLHRLPDGFTLRALLRLSVPAGAQQFLFATGMTTLFWILGQLGTRELAAANVITNLTLVGILPMLGFGLAASSLVGQALGGGERADAARWGWEVSRLALVFVALLELPVALFPELFLGIFIHDPETLALASLPMRLVALTLWWDALGTVLLNAHQGAGHNRRAMAISVSMQWGIFLPLAYLLGPVLGFGLLQIWLANISYRCVQALIFLWSWRQGHWAEVRI